MRRQLCAASRRIIASATVVPSFLIALPHILLKIQIRHS